MKIALPLLALMLLSTSADAQTTFLKPKPKPAPTQPANPPQPAPKAKPAPKPKPAPSTAGTQKSAKPAARKAEPAAPEFMEVHLDKCGGPQVLNGYEIPHDPTTNYCVGSAQLHEGLRQITTECNDGICPSGRAGFAVAIYDKQFDAWQQVLEVPGTGLKVSSKKRHNGWLDVRVATFCDKLDGQGAKDCDVDYWFDGKTYVAYRDRTPPAGSELAAYKAPPAPQPFPNDQEVKFLEKVFLCNDSVGGLFVRANTDQSFANKGFTIYKMPDGMKIYDINVRFFVKTKSYTSLISALYDSYSYVDAEQAKAFAERMLPLKKKNGVVKWKKGTAKSEPNSLSRTLGINDKDTYITAMAEDSYLGQAEMIPYQVYIYDKGIMEIDCIQH